MTESVYEWKEVNSKIIQNNQYDSFHDNPLTSFLYALESSEAKRQYPARLKKFFDYIGIKSNITETTSKENFKDQLNEQSIIFLEHARKNEKWVLIAILSFIEYLKVKQQYGEITVGTIKNYYRSIKLFCEMNDLVIT